MEPLPGHWRLVALMHAPVALTPLATDPDAEAHAFSAETAGLDAATVNPRRTSARKLMNDITTDSLYIGPRPDRVPCGSSFQCDTRNAAVKGIEEKRLGAFTDCASRTWLIYRDLEGI